MAITQNFDLNMIPESEPVIIHVNQYDTGTGRLVAHLYDGDTPYTPTGTAVIQGTKSDGRGFMYNATLSGSTVTADLKDQMSVVAGRVRCQIVVTETSGKTGTFCFDLDVQESALPDDTETSASDYPIIEQLITEAEAAAADAAQAVSDAQGYAGDAEDSAEDAEAWAVGTRGGVDVPSTDPTYHNNSKYWAEHGGGGEGGHTIMDGAGNDMPARNTLQFKNMTVTDDAVHGITIVTGSKGGSSIKVTTTESSLHGEDVTISDGTTTLTETFDNSGIAIFDGVTLTGNLTIISTDGPDTAMATLPVTYYGNYTQAISFWSAPITVTTDSEAFFGRTVTVKDSNNITVGSGTFSSPASGDASCTINVAETGTFTVSCTALDGGTDTKTATVSSTSGASVALHLYVATITITTTTFADGTTVSLTGGQTGSFASGSVTFTVHAAGTYTVSATDSGYTYTKDIAVSAETTYTDTLNTYVSTLSISSTSLSGETVTIYKVDGQTETAVGTETLSSTGQTYTATYTIHESGIYRVKATVSGTTYTSGDAEFTASGQTKSVTINSTLTVTVTLYGATEDIISYTDYNGQQVQQFASGESSKSNVSITVDPDSPTVTFTSGVAKDPSNLSNDYSKTVTITSGMTEIYVMPEGTVLYWYGYGTVTFTGKNIQMTGYNGSVVTPIINYSTNKIYTSQTSGYNSTMSLPNTNILSSYTSLHAVANMMNTNASSNLFLGINANASISSDKYTYMGANANISGTDDVRHMIKNDLQSISAAGTRTVFLFMNYRNINLYALWFD